MRVMTLNLNYEVDRHGAWPARRELVSEVIREAEPDILAFQAVRRGAGSPGGQDQASQLAEQLGYPHVAFQPAMSAPDGAELGSAIISRYPLAAYSSHRLSLKGGHADQTERLLQVARFDLPAGSLQLFNAHFSWVGEQLRDNLAETLLLLRKAAGPALLVGDFNAPAGEGLLDDLSRAGWTDAWDALCGAQAGYTFETGNLSIRIDYVWANAPLSGKLRSIEVVGDRQGPRGEHISDHLGLLVVIDLFS